MNLKADPWDFVQPMDVRRLGEVILDRDEQQRWCRAAMLAGSLPYMWRHKAATVRALIYDKLELKEGDNVLVIGEMVDACGFAGDIRGRIGNGKLHVIDITDEARDAVFAGTRGAGGALGTWRWDYTRAFADASFDCVAVLQAVQHADDWRITGEELLRVMKRGRTLMLAEITFSPRIKLLAEMDIHLETWVEKLSSRVGFDPFAYSYYSAEALDRIFSGMVGDPRTFVWKGIELFWGRKP
jgi:hypothetical protein